MRNKRANTALISAIGVEPDLTSNPSRTELLHALNWYNYTYEIKETKQWILDWMKVDGYSKANIAKYKQSTSSNIRQTWASIARLLSRGVNNASLDENLRQHIDNVLREPVPVKRKLVVCQPINNYLIDVDTLLDQFYASNYAKIPEIEQSHFTTGTAAQSKVAVEYCNQIIEELSLPAAESGYKLTAAQKKRYIKLLETIITRLSSKVVSVKRQRKPRAKKPVSEDKIIRNFQYLKEDKIGVSIDPKKILVSNVVWVYDVKARKVFKYVGADKKPLTISRSSIRGFDPDKSFQKTVRKPQEIVPLIVTEPKRRLEKTIDQLSTKQSTASGQVNKNMLILRAFK